MLIFLQNLLTWLTTNMAATYPGGFFLGQAPENLATFPYMVYHIISAPPDPQYGTGAASYSFTAIRVQFTSYDINALAVVTDSDAFKTALDNSAVSQTYNQTRLTDSLPREDGTIASGQRVWRADVDYEFDTNY